MSYTPPSIRAVEVSSPFYLQLDELMRKTTLPAIIDSLRTTGRIYALSWTKETPPRKAHCFWDSDVFKSMEAVCYYLIKKDDRDLRDAVEEIVKYAKTAQWKDGYVTSTVMRPGHRI